MNTKSTGNKRIIGIFGTALTVAVLGLTVLTAKPAAADGFSFSIATDAFHIGYRSCDNQGGYRYWTPGCYDQYNNWHDGYYSGPVVYAPQGCDNSSPGDDVVIEGGGGWYGDHSRHDPYYGGNWNHYQNSDGGNSGHGGYGYAPHNWGGGYQDHGGWSNGGGRGWNGGGQYDSGRGNNNYRGRDFGGQGNSNGGNRNDGGRGYSGDGGRGNWQSDGTYH